MTVLITQGERDRMAADLTLDANMSSDVCLVPTVLPHPACSLFSLLLWSLPSFIFSFQSLLGLSFPRSSLSRTHCYQEKVMSSSYEFANDGFLFMTSVATLKCAFGRPVNVRSMHSGAKFACQKFMKVKMRFLCIPPGRSQPVRGLPRSCHRLAIGDASC